MPELMVTLMSPFVTALAVSLSLMLDTACTHVTLPIALAVGFPIPDHLIRRFAERKTIMIFFPMTAIMIGPLPVSPILSPVVSVGKKDIALPADYNK